MEGKCIQCSDTCCKFYITTLLVIPSHPSQGHELSSILVSIQLNQKQGTENILEEKGSMLWLQKNFAKTGKCQQGCVSPPKSKCLVLTQTQEAVVCAPSACVLLRANSGGSRVVQGLQGAPQREGKPCMSSSLWTPVTQTGLSNVDISNAPLKFLNSRELNQQFQLFWK